MQFFLSDEAATLSLGASLAQACPSQQHITIHLEGELGAGKTTLTRGFLQKLGHDGKVKSPTYTLVENYQLNERSIYHFDLYRLNDPGELEFLGLDDYYADNSICIIEWAKNGSEYLPQADLTISIQYQNQSRIADIQSCNELGEGIIKNLQI